MGQPFNIDTEEVVKTGEGDMFVSVYNQNNELVGYVEEKINLDLVGNIGSFIELQKDSRFLRAEIVIKNNDGDILEYYKVDLSDSEIGFFDFYKKTFTTVFILIILLIIILYASLNNIIEKKKVVTLLLLIILFGSIDVVNSQSGIASSVFNKGGLTINFSGCDVSYKQENVTIGENCEFIGGEKDRIDVKVNCESVWAEKYQTSFLSIYGSNDPYYFYSLETKNCITSDTSENIDEYLNYIDHNRKTTETSPVVNPNFVLSRFIKPDIDANNYVLVDYKDLTVRGRGQFGHQSIIRGPENNVSAGSEFNIVAKFQAIGCGNAIPYVYVNYLYNIGDNEIYCETPNRAKTNWGNLGTTLKSNSICKLQSNTKGDNLSEIYDSSTGYFKAPDKNGLYKIKMYYDFTYKRNYTSVKQTTGIIPFSVTDSSNDIVSPDDAPKSSCGLLNMQNVVKKPADDLCGADSNISSDISSDEFGGDSDTGWRWQCMNPASLKPASCSARCPDGYVICSDECIEKTQQCQPTEPSQTSFKISCDGPPIAEIPVGEKSVDVTWNVNILNHGVHPYEYEWEYSSNTTDSLTSKCDKGPCSVGKVTVTDSGGKTDSDTCSNVLVTEANSNTNITVPQINTFKLSPSIVNEGQNCGAEWDISGTFESCTLKAINNSQLVFNRDIDNTGRILSSDNGNNLEPGFTYQISCGYKDESSSILTEISEPKTCFLNPSFSE